MAYYASRGETPLLWGCAGAKALGLQGAGHRRPVPGLVRSRRRLRPQAVEAYPAVLTERLIRRLVAERRIAFTYAGRQITLAEFDIEEYFEANRQEPPGGRTGAA